VIDEERFRKNLSLINRVSIESGVEIILAFKGFAMWGVFTILREYISGAAASSLDEARLCFDEIGSPAHTYSPGGMRTDFWKIPGQNRDTSSFMDPAEVATKIVNAVIVTDKMLVTDITINRK